MSSKPIDVSKKFGGVKSRTPLYQAENIRFYWNHCWYCGKEIVHTNDSKKNSNSFTRDHVVPRSQGGRMGANTVPACFNCNKRKCDFTLEQFRLRRFNGKKELFYGEKREAELKEMLAKKAMITSLKTQLTMLLELPKPEFKPKPVKCYVKREFVYHTFMTRLLRRLF